MLITPNFLHFQSDIISIIGFARKGPNGYFHSTFHSGEDWWSHGTRDVNQEQQDQDGRRIGKSQRCFPSNAQCHQAPRIVLEGVRETFSISYIKWLWNNETPDDVRWVIDSPMMSDECMMNHSLKGFHGLPKGGMTISRRIFGRKMIGRVRVESLKKGDKA